MSYTVKFWENSERYTVDFDVNSEARCFFFSLANRGIEAELHTNN